MKQTGVLAVLLFVVLFWRLGAATFWDPDEAHYAETTRELIASGDWLAPSYNDQPFFDKPILFHQFQAVAMLIAGENELGARLVPALAALALVGVTAWLGAAVVSAEVGFVAALLLAVNPGLFALARYAILDTLFTAFLFGGAALVTVAAVRGRPRLQYAGYVLIGLATLTKGPLALALCGLSLLLAIAISPRLRRQLLGLHWAVGVLIAVAVSAPWFIYMYWRFREAFVNGYVLDENLRLFAANRFPNQPGPTFYLQILAVGLLPWTPILIGRLVDDARAAAAGRLDEFDRLLWAWSIAVVAFFSASRFKLDHDVFPAAPSLALLMARAWADARTSGAPDAHRGARIGVACVGPLLIAIGAAIGYFLVVRIDLPVAALVAPAAAIVAGAVLTLRTIRGGPLPPAPLPAASALGVVYVVAVGFVIPRLEARKVMPDLARWIAARSTDARSAAIGTYRLNRWNTAFRFYVDRHVTEMTEPAEAKTFVARGGPFYVVMPEEDYRDLAARGLPIQSVYSREGMWVTSGRALWRGQQPSARFVVVAPKH